MRCYKCGCVFQQMTHVPSVVQMSLYTKRLPGFQIYITTKVLRSRVRDLSGAIETLKVSLMINKYNINARNLLGLVYYGRGEVAEALVEWIISKNLRPRDNIANDISSGSRMRRANWK